MPGCGQPRLESGQSTLSALSTLTAAGSTPVRRDTSCRTVSNVCAGSAEVTVAEPGTWVAGTPVPAVAVGADTVALGTGADVGAGAGACVNVGRGVAVVGMPAAGLHPVSNTVAKHIARASKTRTII